MKTRSGKRRLVIGLGNSLSRDDAFGPRVLDRLVQEGQASRLNAELVHADTDLIRLIGELQDYTHVILIDTVLDPHREIAHDGEVIALEEEMSLSWPDTSPSIHQFSPLMAVRLFRKLYPEAGTRITLVACCTSQVSLQSPAGEPLDDCIVEAGVRLVMSLLQE